MAGATAAVPAALEAAAGRVSSMNYADLYGAGDDTGPGSAVSGSLGYVAASERDAQGPPPAAYVGGDAGLVADLTALGHELLDSPAGLAFLVAGALLLILWRELAD